MGVARQSTNSALPLPARPGALRQAPQQSSGWRGRPPQSALQWLLEGSGWSLLRASTDFVLLCVAVVAALGGPGAIVHLSGARAPLLALPIAAMLVLYVRGLYRVRMRALILDGIIPVVSAISVGAMLVVTAGRLIGHDLMPVSILIRAWLLSLAAVGLGRSALALAQRRARLSGAAAKPVLIVGAGIIGAQVARRLETHPEYGLTPVGFLDDQPRSVAEVGGRNVPVLGTVEDIELAARRTGVKNLIVAFSAVGDSRLSRLIQRAQELGIAVSVVPRMFDTINNRIGYDPVGGLPLLTFSSVNPKGVQFAIKHAFDRIFAAILLLLLSPLLAIIAIAVRLSCGGSVLYRQRRVGRDGKVFDLFKFRSMRPGRSGEGDEADQHGERMLESLLAADIAPGGVEGADRRTAVGRLLRRTSLDELPQLYNVLRGEMSIIGPRPERPEFVDVFEQDIVRYGDRHRVKSGITGWAQVNGLRGRTSLAERIELDNYYIAHWSLGLDFKILLLTMLALLRNAD